MHSPAAIERRHRPRRRRQPESRPRAAASHEPRRVRQRDPRSARARRRLRRRCFPPTTRATASTTSPTCSACRRRCSSATSPRPRRSAGSRSANATRRPAQVTYTVKGDLSQNQTLEGQPLGTRGGTTIRHNFPVDGEYLIRLSLLKLSFGQVFGEGAEGEELEVTLNGQRVKLFKLDEVPMFFMRESPGSHPAKPQPTDPLEERGEDDARHPPRVPLKVKAGRRTSASRSCRRVTPRTKTSFASGLEHLRRLHRHAVRLHDRAAPLARGRSPGRTTRPASATRRAGGACSSAARRQPPMKARAPGRSSPRWCARAYRRAPSDADVESLLAFYQQERDRPATSRPGSRWRCAGSWPIRSSSSASSRHRPERNPETPYRISDTELASRLSFFLWSTIPDDELLKLAIDGKLHEPAVLEKQTRRMLADPEGARARHQLRQPVALSARSEERQSRCHGVPRLRRQPASGFPARNRDALRERHARGPLGARSPRRGLHVRERAARQALRHPERLRSRLPPRAGAERRASRSARARQPAARHVQRRTARRR